MLCFHRMTHESDSPSKGSPDPNELGRILDDMDFSHLSPAAQQELYEKLGKLRGRLSTIYEPIVPDKEITGYRNPATGNKISIVPIATGKFIVDGTPLAEREEPPLTLTQYPTRKEAIEAITKKITMIGGKIMQTPPKPQK